MLFAFPCAAQHYAAQHFGTEQGIESGIHGIIQRTDGTLWLGTAEIGVYRYDSRHLSKFSTKNGLATDICINLFEDKYGNVWVSSAQHGTSYITPQGKLVTVEKTNNATPVNYTYFNLISQQVQGNDDFHNLPYMTYNVYDYEKNTFVKKEKRLFYDVNRYEFIHGDFRYWGNYERTIIYLKDKVSKKEQFYDCSNGKFEPYTFPVKIDDIHNALCDEKGQFCIITAKGIWKENDNKWKQVVDFQSIGLQKSLKFVGFQNFQNHQCHFLQKNEDKTYTIFSFSENFELLKKITFQYGGAIEYYNHIFLDKAQNYWVSTSTGVLKVFPSVFTFSQESKNMLSGLYQVYEDKYGKIWFGSNRNGAAVYDGKSLEPEPDFLKKLRLYYFAGYLKDEKGNMLLMSDNNGLLYFDGEKTYKQYGQRENTSNGKFIGYCIHKTKKGHYVYGSEGRGLAFFKHIDSLKPFGTNGVRFVGEDKGVRTGNVLTISQDNYGRYWFGRPSKGIGVYDEDLDRAVTFQRKDMNLDYGAMASITDTYDNIWFGTDKGLCLFTPPATMPDSAFAFRKNMKRIATDLLGESQVNYLAIWKNKYLVIGNVKGMSLLDLEAYYRSKGEQVISRVLKNYGYPYTGSVQNAVWIDSKEQIWAIADQGVVRFDPNSFVADTVAPTLHIDSISFSNKLKINDLHFVTIGSNPIEVHLRTAINPLLYDNVLFRYRIKGDSIWTMLAPTKDFFDLKNMTGGFYELEIQATKDGILSDIKVLKIKVLPWSLVLSGLMMLFFSAGSWFYFRRQKEKLAANQLLFEKETELEHSRQEQSRLQVQAIVNQLNPHFINNTLQWVQNRLREDKEGLSIIGKLAQNIKIVFKNSREKKAYHSLQSEMLLVQNYLHIQKVRFGESLDYELPEDNVLDKLGAYDVPLMIAQIHIENAIEHGIRNTEEGKGKVTIHLENKDQDYFHIVIEDNGIGRTKSKSIGSSGTQQGTKMLYELETIFNKSNPLPIFTQLYEDEYLTDAEGVKYGTKVTVKIPKKYKYES